jgi:hypothetical protein
MKKVQMYRVIMTFDMSWGSISRRKTLSARSDYPRTFIDHVKSIRHASRGRFIPASRLIEARIEKIA